MSFTSYVLTHRRYLVFSIFLICSSTEYDNQGLVYKAFDDYRLFKEGYVESLLTKPLPSVIWLAICFKMVVIYGL